MTTIVICYPVNPEERQAIETAAGSDRVLISSQSTIAQDIFEAEIYCGHARNVELPWPEVVAAGKLKWIQSSAAGLDHCLHPAVVHSSVVVSGASGLFAPQVAEHTLALLLSLLRRLPEFAEAQQRRHYERRPTDDLQGKRVGIAGLGLNGQAIAKRLRHFEVALAATDWFPQSIPSRLGVEVFPADELLRLCQRSEILIAALPLTAETKNLIDADAFAALPRGAYFVNVGRGQTVVESALLQALESGHLRAAGLDVVAQEPLPPESPLWSAKNLVITPHVGAQAARRYADVTRFFCNNLMRWKRGESLLNRVDKQLGFPRPEARFEPD